MKIKEGYMLRTVAGCSVVVAVGMSTMDFNGMINLNDTGAFLWKKLESGASEDELVSAMLSEYDVDEETAKHDIDAFLKKLKEAELLCE